MVGTFHNTGGGRHAVACFQHQGANTTGGGTFSGGAYRTRPLNTTIKNDGFAALASNQVTLQPGRYVVVAEAAVYGVANNNLRLRDVTNGVTLIIGSVNSNYAAYDGMGQTVLSGEFELTVEAALELQHYCSTTQADTGFGWYNSGETTEVYASITFVKVG